MQHVGPIHSSLKEKALPHIYGVCIVGDSHIHPVVSSNETTLRDRA
jgi:hypothetical protein